MLRTDFRVCDALYKWRCPDEICQVQSILPFLFFTNSPLLSSECRLTWDGNNLISTLIQNRWDGCVRGYSGDSVHEDEIFKNAQYGMFLV